MNSAKNIFAMGTVARLPNVLSASGHTGGVRRAAQAAESLSLKNIWLARSRLMQEALRVAVALCYERIDDDADIFANVDETRRVLIALPWSSKNYGAYGLRRVEADALRLEMHSRCNANSVHPPLWRYLDGHRSWFLNSYAYQTQADAVQYIESNPVSWQTLWRFANRPHSGV